MLVDLDKRTVVPVSPLEVVVEIVSVHQMMEHMTILGSELVRGSRMDSELENKVADIDKVVAFEDEVELIDDNGVVD